MSVLDNEERREKRRERRRGVKSEKRSGERLEGREKFVEDYTRLADNLGRHF